MSSFSQRMGLAQVRFEPQVESLDQSTRTAIWNWMHQLESNIEKPLGGYEKLEMVYSKLWRDTFERDLSMFQVDSARYLLKKVLSDGDWHSALSVLEDYVASLERTMPGLGQAFSERVNEEVLSRFLVGYRFTDLQLSPITEEIEVESINSAVANPDVSSNAQSHLKKAISLLSSRDSPNYSKSMDEALAAVEASVHSVTGNKKLSAGLKMLSRNNAPVHPALLSAWEKMYAWSSDDGIRHAEFESLPKDQATATYILVTCSAFVNYLASATNISSVTE